MKGQSLTEEESRLMVYYLEKQLRKAKNEEKKRMKQQKAEEKKLKEAEENESTQDTQKSKQKKQPQENGKKQKKENKQPQERKEEENKTNNQTQQKAPPAAHSNESSLFAHLDSYKQFSYHVFMEKASQNENQVHRSIIDVAFKFCSGQVKSANSRCTAMLLALSHFISDYRVPPRKELYRDLPGKLQQQYNFLVECYPAT